MKTIKLVILLTCLCSITIAQNSGYKIVNKFHLEGDEGWDGLSVDESTGRLFISHGSAVQIIDESNGTLLGTISGLMGVHCIALANDLNKGFISCGRDSSVTVFDMKTLTATDKLNMTGRNADAIEYDPFSHRVFVFNGASNNATVIDAKTNSIAGTIALDGKPEFSVADGKEKIYVNLEDKSMVSVINTTSMQVEKTWSLTPGEEPTGIALDNSNRRLFIDCSNKLMVIMDADNGNIVTTMPIGDRVDGAGFDTANKLAYSPNGEGSLTVIRESDKNTFNVIETVETQRGARTIVVDSKTHHIFLPTAEFDDPPPPTEDNPHPRPKIRPGTFVILDVAPLN